MITCTGVTTPVSHDVQIPGRPSPWLCQVSLWIHCTGAHVSPCSKPFHDCSGSVWCMQDFAITALRNLPWEDVIGPVDIE